MSIEYKCKKCPKEYSTYKSLWRHDALKHKVDVSPKLANLVADVSHKLVKNELKCNFCDNTYKHRSSKSKHEKKCKQIKFSGDKLEQLENKLLPMLVTESGIVKFTKLGQF